MEQRPRDSPWQAELLEKIPRCSRAPTTQDFLEQRPRDILLEKIPRCGRAATTRVFLNTAWLVYDLFLAGLWRRESFQKASRVPRQRCPELSNTGAKSSSTKAPRALSQACPELRHESGKRFLHKNVQSSFAKAPRVHPQKRSETNQPTNQKPTRQPVELGWQRSNSAGFLEHRLDRFWLISDWFRISRRKEFLEKIHRCKSLDPQFLSSPKEFGWQRSYNAGSLEDHSVGVWFVCG